MKKLSTEIYSSTEKDKHIAGLFEDFGRDHLQHITAKLEPLQYSIALHRAYAEVHKQSWQRFEGLG